MKVASGNSYKSKIILIGPTKSGKSVLANFLGDQVDLSSHAYRPTAGVRILEFETSVSAGHIQANMEVELWDCGGESENIWPAIAAKADGVLLVYDAASQDASSLNQYYEYFVKSHNIKDSHCAVFGNSWDQEADDDLQPPLPNCAFSITNLSKDPDLIKKAFNSLLMKVYGKLSASREKQEQSILT